MYKSFISILIVALSLSACQTSSEKTEDVKTIVADKDSLVNTISDSLSLTTNLSPCINDSLNALANLMSGIADTNSIYSYVQGAGSFKSFSAKPLAWQGIQEILPPQTEAATFAFSSEFIIFL